MANSRKRWTPEELALLRERYPITRNCDLARIFSCRVESIHAAAKVYGLHKSGRKRHGRLPWKPEEIAILRQKYADTPTAQLARELGHGLDSVYRKAHSLGLEKSEAYMQSPAACRLRRGDNIGAAFRFRKGQVPPNKGLRRPGYAPGRMAETQFKKGQKGWNTAPLGAHRYSKEGYLQRKISETGYPPRDWKAVHLIVWEEVHGPVPPGHCVTFKDGDKQNIVIGNLECITKAERLERTRAPWPPELKQAIQLSGVLSRLIHRRERAQEQTERSA